MTMHHHHHQQLPRHGMHMVRRPGAIPHHRQPHFLNSELPTLVKREPLPSTETESSSTQTCGSGDKCEKPTSTTTTTTLPVVLGAVVPIVCAILVLIYLHRRNVKKLRSEDANDKHKSLDFGLDLEPTAGGKPMRQTEKLDGNYNHAKGVSMDIGPSPYLLPPGLQGSRESLHSISRTIGGADDKYRSATSYAPGDSVCVRSHQRALQDDASSFAGSTNKAVLGEDMNQGLLRNAQRMSRSSPPLYNSPPADHGPIGSDHPEHELGFQLNLPRSPSPVLIPGAPTINEPTAIGSHPDRTEDTSAMKPSVPAVNIHGVADTPEHDGGSDPSASNVLSEDVARSQRLSVDPRRDTRRMTLGLRPLPPEDPSDNPEQRANRIRSFYKEYFDESKTGRETYYEGYGPEMYHDDSYMYDPAYGGYDAVPAPFAEPVTRRAMTPPPRAPPRFQGASRHMASGSVSGFSERFQSPGPRAFSSASGRMPGPRAPRKPAPPPSPLQILPTPHMLNDDSIMGAIEWAPGKNFRDQRDGRSETPLGGLRPFSPGARAHTPLVSAFNELSAMPSPHALRKSGAYDNLDFAPPPRFKNTETASDAGSIRSNGTGISGAHLHNIRTGAYRISRLPADTVGTKDDLRSNLRPTWDMRQ
ncbi:hypothetical protein P170DRAFT_431957 [Aspergillus steynii IBT 23096]|uniref:Uncharacterized protein n=1 Tax=Aspergillus steynii IBT 23096 TaxID=1392250 RepID=A0A2I2GN80_9EURO|nr:uncharacterized protein P170DRAFT_431957 [Aspergillus steynii IBT 23096]PLB54326.1 hypothetical protein P170DRAFT_431957 [Aspergillus steynii IBT 23096]